MKYLINLQLTQTPHPCCNSARHLKYACSSSPMPSLKSRMFVVYMFSNTFLNQPYLIALMICICEKKKIFSKSSTKRTHAIK